MSRSYEKINYSLRPSKGIERKMILEALRRLSEFRSIESYRYIGFGSTYFTDFHLIHKRFDIKTMISIERDVANRQRFEFNKPFGCIELRFGESNDVLPILNWTDIPTIAWLDYDGRLNSSILADIKTFFSLASLPSVLLVTVNAQPGEAEPTRPDARLAALKATVGDDKVPADIRPKDLRDWGTAAICRRIIDNEINETIADRNGARAATNEIRYRQLFNFHYSDGARMLTVGGILYDQGLSGRLESCAFHQLNFIREGGDAFLIQPPNLTTREMRRLNTVLPSDPARPRALPGVPDADIQRYAEMYRYFPMFTETEV